MSHRIYAVTFIKEGNVCIGTVWTPERKRIRGRKASVVKLARRLFGAGRVLEIKVGTHTAGPA